VCIGDLTRQQGIIACDISLGEPGTMLQLHSEPHPKLLRIDLFKIYSKLFADIKGFLLCELLLP
jgi:hypothetical protein